MIDKETLLLKIKYLEKFLSGEVIEYLYSLINLEISVFNKEKYNEFLKELDIFFDIALFNIYNRSINLINNLDTNKEELIKWDILNSYMISYKLDKDYDFLRLNKDKTDCLNLFYHGHFDYIKELEKCDKKLEELKKAKLIYRRSSYSFDDIFHKEKSINERIEFLNEYGLELEELTDLINDTLFDDFNMSFDKHIKDGNDREIVKNLPWCRVYKIK